MIEFREDPRGLVPAQLEGFFEGWPNPPAPEVHLRLLEASSKVVLAVDTGTDRVIGFITAPSDSVLSAYIPLLEVLPEYRHRGIGSQLVRGMLDLLDGLYMVDLICDAELKPFYEAHGMRPGTGMVLRRFESQSGRV